MPAKKRTAALKFSEAEDALSDADFVVVEQALGLSLPADLREFYALRDGGRPSRPIYLDEDEDDYEVKTFYRMKHKVMHEPLVHETYRRLAVEKLLLPTRLIPFAADSGGNLYCMDVECSDIWFWCADDCEPGDPEAAVTRIADKLAVFIDGLVSIRQAYG